MVDYHRNSHDLIPAFHAYKMFELKHRVLAIVNKLLSVNLDVRNLIKIANK